MTSLYNNSCFKKVLLLVREIESICFDITNLMLTRLNYQSLIIKNQNAGHRRPRQNKKKEGRYRIKKKQQQKKQNGYLNS